MKKGEGIFNKNNPAFLLVVYTVVISIITMIGTYDFWTWVFELVTG
jgi:nitrate reductase NapE component